MPRETRVSSAISRTKSTFAWQRLAARQWGVVDIDDLRACGLSRRRSRSASRLAGFTPFIGVFTPWATRRISLRGRCLAAVKACGPGAVISHFAAAFLWGMLEPFDCLPDVTAPTPRRHPSINTHQRQEHRRHDPPRHPRHHTDPDPHPPLGRSFRSRPCAAPSTRPSTAASSRPSNSSPPTTAAPRNSAASWPQPPRPARRTRTSPSICFTRPESPSPSSTRASAVRPRSRTSCGPTSTSSWKPTVGVTTTIRWHAPTTATSSESSKPSATRSSAPHGPR